MPSNSNYIDPQRARVHQAIVTLTDAQIKTLPTISQELVPAPGAGLANLLLPHWMLPVLRLDTTAGVYANASATAAVQFGGEVGNIKFGGFDDLLTYGADAVMYPSVSDIIGGGGNVQGREFAENSAVFIAADNDGMGNFTGGHVDNTLRISVVYMIVNLDTGQFI